VVVAPGVVTVGVRTVTVEGGGAAGAGTLTVCLVGVLVVAVACRLELDRARASAMPATTATSATAAIRPALGPPPGPRALPQLGQRPASAATRAPHRGQLRGGAGPVGDTDGILTARAAARNSTAAPPARGAGGHQAAAASSCERTSPVTGSAWPGHASLGARVATLRMLARAVSGSGVKAACGSRGGPLRVVCGSSV
jgi:hypothetical protein